MHYSKSHKRLVIGTRNGVLSKLNFEAQVPDEDSENEDGDDKPKQTIDTPVEILGRFHTNAVIGLKALGDSSQFVSISKDQTMVIWEASAMQQLVCIPQITPPTALDVSVDGNVVFVGSECGEFSIYDVCNRQNPRLIK